MGGKNRAEGMSFVDKQSLRQFKAFERKFLAGLDPGTMWTISGSFTQYNQAMFGSNHSWSKCDWMGPDRKPEKGVYFWGIVGDVPKSWELFVGISVVDEDRASTGEAPCHPHVCHYVS